MVKKITVMQQRSTEQRRAVDSRRQNVSQSVSVSSLETVCLTIQLSVKSSPPSVFRNTSTVC